MIYLTELFFKKYIYVMKLVYFCTLKLYNTNNQLINTVLFKHFSAQKYKGTKLKSLSTFLAHFYSGCSVLYINKIRPKSDKFWRKPQKLLKILEIFLRQIAFYINYLRHL